MAIHVVWEVFEEVLSFLDQFGVSLDITIVNVEAVEVTFALGAAANEGGLRQEVALVEGDSGQ